MMGLYKCRNKACAKTWAFDYPERRTVPIGYGKTKTKVFRINERGREIEAGYDALMCPHCKSGKSSNFNLVRGVYSERHVCDTRCTEAKGHQCTCSCAGRNHGKAFLCEAA